MLCGPRPRSQTKVLCTYQRSGQERSRRGKTLSKISVRGKCRNINYIDLHRQRYKVNSDNDCDSVITLRHQNDYIMRDCVLKWILKMLVELISSPIFCSVENLSVKFHKKNVICYIYLLSHQILLFNFIQYL